MGKFIKTLKDFNLFNLKHNLVQSESFEHPSLGLVSVRVLSTARNITARWKSASLLSVTVPPRISTNFFSDALREMSPRLLARRPSTALFLPGWKFSSPEMSFEVRATDKNFYSGTVDKAKGLTIFFRPVEADAEAFNLWIKKALNQYARAHAQEIILPLALSMARKLDVHPASIDISYGQRVLGRCDAKCRILLSRNLVFYSNPLRELVIAHEFAHLTHLNHSPAFYKLLDTYLGGRHGELRQALKSFKLPFNTST